MATPCPTCGRPFDTERGVRVHHAHAHGETLPNRECAACGEPFHCEHERRYCSESCRLASVSREGENNPNYRGAEKETTCERCGVTFEYYPSEKAGRFCTDCVERDDWQEPPSLAAEANPNYRGGKVELVCDACGVSFERYPSNVGDGATLCSNECRAVWLSEAYSGSGHPNWQGGPVGAYGPGWRRVRERALERDGFECVLCGAGAEELDRNPDVHHIVPVRRFLDASGTTVADAHTLDNVVCLCASCHRRAERGTVSDAELEHRAGLA